MAGKCGLEPSPSCRNGWVKSGSWGGSELSCQFGRPGYADGRAIQHGIDARFNWERLHQEDSQRHGTNVIQEIRVLRSILSQWRSTEMKLRVEPYISQASQWPPEGHYILAQYDEEAVVVYQAYRPAIGQYAAEHGCFGGRFKLSRMSWIKPKFLWMMYRSGWGQKEGAGGRAGGSSSAVGLRYGSR